MSLRLVSAACAKRLAAFCSTRGVSAFKYRTFAVLGQSIRYEVLCVGRYLSC